MRLKELLVGFMALAATAAPPAVAADLQYGRNGVRPDLPDLGPAGDGRRLFLKLNCYLCHGSYGGGAIAPDIQHIDIDDATEALMNGETYGGMPSFRKYVTKQDIQDITAYLDSIGTKNEPTWFDWWLPHPKQ